MFTGLVEACVPVVQIRRQSGAMDLSLDPGEEIAGDLDVGASLAVNGACLTVTAIRGSWRTFRVITETLGRTNLGRLKVGDRVNIERSLRLGDRLGGHWVQGHVDGMGTLKSRDQSPGQTLFKIDVDPGLTAQMVPKGSICLDGISLTLVDVWDKAFTCALIPETLERTTWGRLPIGSKINVETDILGKYVAKLLGGQEGLDLGKLRDEGYL